MERRKINFDHPRKMEKMKHKCQILTNLPLTSYFESIIEWDRKMLHEILAGIGAV